MLAVHKLHLFTICKILLPDSCCPKTLFVSLKGKAHKILKNQGGFYSQDINLKLGTVWARPYLPWNRLLTAEARVRLGQATDMEQQEYARALEMSSMLLFDSELTMWVIICKQASDAPLLLSKGGYGCPNARENEWYYKKDSYDRAKLVSSDIEVLSWTKGMLL